MMALIEGNDLPYSLFGNMRVILGYLIQRTAGRKIGDDGVRQYTGSLNDGLAAHLTRHTLNSLATFPSHRSTFRFLS
jgi:hypothetical protein